MIDCHGHVASDAIANAVAGAEMAEFAKEHIKRVIFGTDYPTITGVQRQIDWVTSLPLTEGDKERILWRNAAELFHLDQFCGGMSA